jgi:tetratricopeptide (TPR) repeat protein
MLPFAPDWRWFIGRDDSPWYPSMRLFRQQGAGDWYGVTARVRAALATRAAGPTAPRPDRAARAELTELVRAANEHHQAKRHSECEAALRRVLEIDPSNATALHVLALTRHALDEQAEALSLIRRAIEVDPQAAFYCALGIMLHGAGQCEEAVEAGLRALEINPDDPIVYNGIGASLSSLGRPSEAMESYRRALAINPNYFECWANWRIRNNCCCVWTRRPTAIAVHSVFNTTIRRRNARLGCWRCCAATSPTASPSSNGAGDSNR